MQLPALGFFSEVSVSLSAKKQRLLSISSPLSIFVDLFTLCVCTVPQLVCGDQRAPRRRHFCLLLDEPYHWPYLLKCIISF